MNVKLQKLTDLLSFAKDGGKLNRKAKRTIAKLERQLRVNRPTIEARTLPDAPRLAVA